MAGNSLNPSRQSPDPVQPSSAAQRHFSVTLSLILQSHRNLSQLPNFAFSVPLAYFFLSQQEERPELERSQARERAARLIQLALIMFPSGESVPTGKAIPAGFVAVLCESQGWIPGRRMQRQEFAKGL